MFPGKSLLYNLFIVAILLSQPVVAQVVFKDLPGYKINTSDLLFFDITDTRSVIPLNGNWNVYPADDKDKKSATIKVPSIFEGTGDFVFEKTFQLTETQINSNKYEVNFFGINYSTDISLNNVIIYRHAGGEFPFKVALPRDILKSDKANILSLKISFKLDSKNTIPLKQRFLFPKNFGGIIKDVYLHSTPNVSVKNISWKGETDYKTGKTTLTINTIVENKEFKKLRDTVDLSTEFILRSTLFFPDGSNSTSLENKNFNLSQNKEEEFATSVSLSNSVFWTPENPAYYVLRTELWRGENLVDRYDQNIALFELKATQESLLLNNKPFNLLGVTYFVSSREYGSLTSYEQLEKDIIRIKEAGFNSVRFSKQLPHPYLIRLCEELGLIAFVEPPLADVPEGLSNSQNFIARSKNYVTSLLEAYNRYSVIGGFGFGSSYLLSSDAHRSFISDLAGTIKNTRSKSLTYASFVDFSSEEIPNLDLYGLEILDKISDNRLNDIKNLRTQFGKGKTFIGEATYTVNVGQTDGYVNTYSYEAQAKFFDDIYSLFVKDSLSGFFINTMYDLHGDYASLINGYSEDNLYNIGLIGEDRVNKRLALKVLSARMKNQEKVTIPIGSEKDDAPMVFIITGLLLAVLMGVLVNSGRKFREDASRALLRPYNFFADVRDQRIISAYHSFFLAGIVALVASLVICNILFFLKTNVLFEKLLLSFGSPAIMSAVSYLSWNPINALVWLFIIFIIKLILLTIIIKGASFFVKTRVYLSSVFFTVSWAMLPFVLLIPVGIVLYRLLDSGVANLYIAIFFVLFFFWIIYRLLKGIYVIYDVNPGGVYFYSFLVVLFLAVIFVLYYEVNNSFIQHIVLTLKQFNIIG